MKEIINIQGKWYNHLGTWGGKCYLGKITDHNNEVEKQGVIWKMQPFFYQNEKWYGNLLFKWYKLKRWLSKFYCS
jgi:hypothetical protein